MRSNLKHVVSTQLLLSVLFTEGETVAMGKLSKNSKELELYRHEDTTLLQLTLMGKLEVRKSVSAAMGLEEKANVTVNLKCKFGKSLLKLKLIWVILFHCKSRRQSSPIQQMWISLVDKYLPISFTEMSTLMFAISNYVAEGFMDNVVSQNT